MTDGVRPIKVAEVPVAAQALANAFFKDPLQNYAFPDEKERGERSPGHFKVALEYGVRYGEVYIAANGAGASIWLKPGETEITPDRAERSGFTNLPSIMGPQGFDRFISVIGYAEELHKSDMPEPHWYTMVLGVDPLFQGQGYGRLLLQPVFDKAKTDGVPIYLETAQPANVSFYKKLGFQVIRELVEPSSGMKMWTFRLDQ
ncbi:MAG: GNAT family N-acetyltransferase [Pyrinomonadaceae bacterium]